MEIHYLNSVDSTQKYLINKIKTKKLKAPVAVLAKHQTNGVGSRDNSWESHEDNFYCSFAISIDDLPDDLLIQSISIYFAFILKEVLSHLNSDVILKWPNDFYLNSKKVGGVITNKLSNIIVCGIGLNFNNTNQNFGKLDIDINNSELLNIYFNSLVKKEKWKHIFSKYKLEFYLNNKFTFHHKDEILQLSDAFLNEDGSLSINNERIYSLR